MANVQLKFGASNHGRRLSLDEFDEAEFEPGCRKTVERSFPYGSIFSTKLLPGFSLEIDPRK